MFGDPNNEGGPLAMASSLQTNEVSSSLITTASLLRACDKNPLYEAAKAAISVDRIVLDSERGKVILLLKGTGKGRITVEKAD